MALTPFMTTYGPWAIVCGASEGLGAALATELAQRGLNLVMVARRAEPLAELADRLKVSFGIQTLPISMDLGHAHAASQLMTSTSHLEIGLLVYNAAYSPIQPFVDLAWEGHQQLIALNCNTLAECVWRMGNRLKERGSGGVLLIGSMAGFQGTPLLAHYAATKAYGLTLVEGLYPEWKKLGLHIHCAVAGATLTPGYYASKPQKIWPPAPEQTPTAVAKEALRQLGKAPVHITGLPNRLAAAFMRLLPRRAARLLMARTTMRIYAKEV